MPTLAKDSGIVGLPAGVKEAGRRVDFRPDDFTLAIETKGYRIAWARASYCPCQPVNAQTEQPDPECTLCGGEGWLLFAPANAYTAAVGELDATQKALIGSTYGVVLGIMSSFVAEQKPYDVVQQRLEGTVNLTVRPENRLGYYDRIINLDTTITFSQIVEADGSDLLVARYPIVDVNLIRTVSKVYARNTDFQLEAGNLRWLTAPPTVDELVSLHYYTYPHWRIVNHPHATRATIRKFKTSRPASPAGDPIDLPIQAVCKYEFLL